MKQRVQEEQNGGMRGGPMERQPGWEEGGLGEGGVMFLKILQITRLSLTSVFNGSNTKLCWIVVIK